MYSKASEFFKKDKVDFCWGGDEPIKDQFAKTDLDGKKVLDELNKAFTEWDQAGNEAKDWDEVPLEELIDHIVHHHHAYLREELPALGEFVTRIYRVHGADH